MDFHEAYHYPVNRITTNDYKGSIRESCCSVCFGYNSLLLDCEMVRNGKQYHFKQICSVCKYDLEYLFYRL